MNSPLAAASSTAFAAAAANRRPIPDDPSAVSRSPKNCTVIEVQTEELAVLPLLVELAEVRVHVFRPKPEQFVHARDLEELFHQQSADPPRCLRRGS